ncbi:Lrp/AsnC family transcriptional regulator [Candidatus Desantisbacteria bacterium]|nr:Lrp/AsnC family transcriptional regulator [Candidatus Desantisbacteria bacterium]
MEKIDRIILNALQEDFPVDLRPFGVLAQRIQISEDEIVQRVGSLVEKKIIRRIGASLNPKAVGLTTTLIGMNVPEERIDEVADIVNAYTEVTHNYQREGDYNLWFTLAVKSAEEIEKIVDTIRQKTGIEKIINLPSIKTFKIRVRFDV